MSRKIKIWPKIWEKFESYVLPKIEGSGSKIDVENFYWFGSRMAGKTLNVFLSMFEIAKKYPKKKFNWVWSRDRVQDSFQTFNTLLEFLKLLDLKFSKKTKSKMKIRINKRTCTIEFKNIYIQVIPLQGTHNLVYKKGKATSSHQLLGFSFPAVDVRFFIFEEAYQTYAVSRKALQLAARFAPIRFNFFLFNNYARTSDVVDFVETQLPYDPKLMGESSVTNIDSPVKDVVAEQQVLMRNEKNHIWRLNFLLLKKDGLLLRADEEILWTTMKDDPARAGTVLFGKCGIPEQGIYGSSLKKLKWISQSDFWTRLNLDLNWQDWNLYAGIDIGYVNDDSALVVVAFDDKHKELIVLDSFIVKTAKRNIDLNSQSKLFIEFLSQQIKIFCRETETEMTLFISNLIQSQLSFSSWITNKGLADKIRLYVFHKPPIILERVLYVRRKLSQNQISFIKNPSNKFLYDQLDGLTWAEHAGSKYKRVGRDDLVEAFEVACLNAINRAS